MSNFSFSWKFLICTCLFIQVYLLLKLNGVFDASDSLFKLGERSSHLETREISRLTTFPPTQTVKLVERKVELLQQQPAQPPPQNAQPEKPAQPGWKEPEKTCKPLKRFVYIKTHKSGSSTLTNVFHRFASKHKLRVALPKGNYFLGWPASWKIPVSYVKTDKEPEVWCSAHTRYDHSLLDSVMPNATYITVLRNPPSHFISSWHYWNSAAHMAEKHPEHTKPSVEEFMEDPNKWWPYGKKSDRDLLQNNAAFDLGLNMNSTREDVLRLIDELEKYFGMVLITEYMDESLVLMKRRFCWDLDDVIYYGLKVIGPKRKRSSVAPALAEKIRKFSWMDVMLHDHFNKSLWDAISREVGFNEEVEELQRRMADMSDRCWPWQGWSEDRHRKAILEGDPASQETQCHLAQLDSPGYSKYLKAVQGIPDPECHTQGMPRRRVVFIKTHKTGSSTITNIMHRASLRLRLKPLLPKNNYYFSWPQLEDIDQTYSKLPTNKSHEMLCSAHTRLHFPTIDKLVPDAVYITILRDPVKHFISSWNYWHTSDHIFAKTGQRVTMEQFLADPQAHWSLLAQTDINVLQNSMVFDLGLPHEPTREQVELLIQSIFDRFSLVLITDYFDESMVMLRRDMCWFLSDVLNIPLKAAPGGSTALTTSKISEELAQSIRKLNWADAMLFDVFNRTFWERVESEVNFTEELNRYRQLMANVSAPCTDYMGKNDDEHRKYLLDANLKRPTAETTCRLRLLDSVGFVKFLKRRNGLIEPECHTQGRKRGKIVFIKTHKTASSTIVNIMHRFAFQNDLRVVLPRDNMFLGWPYTNVKDMVVHYGDPPQYDMFVSGHSRYVKEQTDMLVPNAQYITILRDPVSHFLSSWWHWHVADHIAANGATAPSIVDFVRQPDQWWNVTKWTDKWLVHNSMAFDLGLEGEPTPEQVDQLIAHMDEHFSMVLITEKMDESLVLLRRTLCWDMDDILYLSLKVTPDSSRVNPDPELVREIRKFNQADTQLYSHFRKRLDERISQEIDFEQELGEFRARQQQVQAECQEYTMYQEDRIRKDLLKSEISDGVRRCMLKALDSKGFVKLIKRKLSVPFAECHSSNIVPLTQFALVNLESAADNIIANIVLRYAMTHSLSIVVPHGKRKSVSFEGQRDFQVLSAAKDKQDKVMPNIVVSPFVGAPLDVRRRLQANVRITLVLQDPVTRFVEAWTRLRAADLLAEFSTDGNPVLMEEFLNDPWQWLPHLTPAQRAVLENPVAHRFGIKTDDQSLDVAAAARTVYENTNILLSGDEIEKTLVVLRRWMCWTVDDVLISTAALQELKPAVTSVSDSVANAIRKLCWVDQGMYNPLLDIFNNFVDSQVDFESELQQLQTARQQLDETCRGTSGPSAARLRRVLSRMKGPSVCDLVGLNVGDFTKVFRDLAK